MFIATSLRLLVGAIVGLHLLATARAEILLPEYQQRVPLTSLEQPEDLVRAAFATPYGRALLAEFALIVRETVDPGCLQYKGLDAPTLITRAQDIFLRYGTRMVEAHRNLVNVDSYEATLVARVGRSDAKAMMTSLGEDANVRKLLELERPVRLADIAEEVVENFDRYRLLHRINLKRDVSLADAPRSHDPSEKAAEALKQFLASNKSPRLQRYLALSKIAYGAWMEATDRKAMLTVGFGPRYFSGVELDLAEICISQRR